MIRLYFFDREGFPLGFYRLRDFAIAPQAISYGNKQFVKTVNISDYNNKGPAAQYREIEYAHVIPSHAVLEKELTMHITTQGQVYFNCVMFYEENDPSKTLLSAACSCGWRYDQDEPEGILRAVETHSHAGIDAVLALYWQNKIDYARTIGNLIEAGMTESKAEQLLDMLSDKRAKGLL